MRGSRFLRQLAMGALVVAAAAGGGLLSAGVAPAQEPTPTNTPFPTPVLPVRSTVTTLTTSPASPVDEGTAVTLNAQVITLPFPDNDGITEITGTVQFKDGDATIGAPVPLSARGLNGTASTTTSTLAVGSHQLTAMFTPINPSFNPRAFLPSTSPAVTFVVNAIGATDTRTTLWVFPTVPLPGGTPRLLLAQVSPIAAAGTVQFKDGATALGTPVPVMRGLAFAITHQLSTVGGHPLTAVFTPADLTAFRPSTSNTVEVLVRPTGA